MRVSPAKSENAKQRPRSDIPHEQPSLVAPARIIASAVLRSRIPPAALTPIFAPTVLRISFTSATVAPPFPNPVDVLTKSKPAFFAADDFLLRLAAFADDFGKLAEARVDVALEKPLVEDHVKLVRAVFNRLKRLLHLGEGAGRAERKAYHGAHGDAASFEKLAALRNPARIHAHGREAVLLSLAAEARYVGRLRVRPEQSVVDVF